MNLNETTRQKKVALVRLARHSNGLNRYHIGESMLPSMRHFLKFIDAYEKWDSHGFNVKVWPGPPVSLLSVEADKKMRSRLVDNNG